MIQNSQTLPVSNTVAYVLWHIWKARNQFIFHGQQMNPRHVVDMAIIGARSALYSFPHPADIVHPTINRGDLWHPPDPGIFKVNFDGAFQPNTTIGTIVSICRDHNSRLIDGLTQIVAASLALQIEFQALLITLRHLEQTGQLHNKLIIKSDSLILVESVNERSLPPWEV
ncbi:hypothetical protein ACJRO7_001126 [Eucalyptus globulus]|uniref:RNase H type-1 domain-containing protein n=1 Tax=Eucalyptus globulus TaxID=34317 RepID=A0ABD3LQ08_EUCGL